tara:strand:- start:3004 stop:3252 length:249 start_codon:yes stop_codon:yes gene_type:complete
MSEENRKVLECSNCSKKLVEIWIKNSSDKLSKVRAECCYCGDRSYSVEVRGEFYIGGTDNASLEGVEEKNGTQIIKTSKVRV